MMNKKVLIIILVFFLINISFSDTTKYITFNVRVDNTAPTYSNMMSNTTNIYAMDEMIEFSAYWQDDYTGLKEYYFEWNITDNFENSTAKNFVGNYSNVTKTVSDADYEGKSVAFSYFAYDNNNNLRHANYSYFNIINEKPEYSLMTQSTDNPNEGDIINLSSYWTDNFNVYDTILETNKSSVWSSEELKTVDAIQTWSNFTFNTSGYAGTVIAWRIKASDNVNNINTTSELIFTVN